MKQNKDERQREFKPGWVRSDDQERPNQDGSVTKVETGCRVCEGAMFPLGACKCRGPAEGPGPERSPGPRLNGSGRGWTEVAGDESEVKTWAVPGEQPVWMLTVAQGEVADSFPGDVVANCHTLAAWNHRRWSSHSSEGQDSASELSTMRVRSGPWAGTWLKSLRRPWCSWTNLDGCVDPARWPPPPSSCGLSLCLSVSVPRLYLLRTVVIGFRAHLKSRTVSYQGL